MTRVPQLPRRRTVPTTRRRRFGLHLEIDRTSYILRPLACHPHAALRAFQLLKPDGTRYDVAQTPHGPECDCPDFIYRRAGLDPAGCKHVQALVAFGLIAGQEIGRRSPDPSSDLPAGATAAIPGRGYEQGPGARQTGSGALAEV